MNIKELKTFNLSDAIKFHDDLNTKIWINNRLRPEVKKQLKTIAQDFIEELGINSFDVEDLTISGSNAAYSYTPHSDLDLHILIDMNELPNNDVYRELFTAKKTIYNDKHNIKIYGINVELYVQDTNEPVISLGEYSILRDEWIKVPSRKRANFDQTTTKAKYDKLHALVLHALKSKDLLVLNNILKKIKQYRQAGLDKGGEFSPENLAYKALRNQDYITKLYDLRDKLHSEELTIETMYQQFNERKLATHLQKLPKFFKRSDPLTELVPERKTHTFALHPDKWISTFYSLTGKDPKKLKYYKPAQVEIVPGTLVGDMVFANRFYRAETDEEKYDAALRYKNSLKPYEQANVDLYKMPELLIPRNIDESASGYIPSKKEANDPRYSMALTVDIHPNTMKKDAKKFGNTISRAGIPPTLKSNGKF